MKLSLKLAALVTAVAIPALSQAQVDTSVTRAQVRQQLVQLEKAGYNPAVDGDYPSDLEHAEAIVTRSDGTSGYGSTTVSASQSGQ